MEPTILYEDKDILAINKPAGLVIHGNGLPAQTGKTKEPTLVDWLLSKYPQIKEVGEPGRNAKGEIIFRPGIVHRLDKETSGVMLIAKTQKSFEFLKKQFQNHEIKKIYHAFVVGEMKTMQGTIDRPIGRSTKDFRLWSAQRGARGEMREAITDYKVISKFQGYSFVEISLKTGRTHQIRVHFKAISYPLVSDSLYAPKHKNTLGFERLALHSYEITFTDLKGISHTITAPYPEDFIQALILLQNH
ncbi:MAG: RluA family pseudouridine synthase [Candidatus Zambryskibacteria bacterium]|nr:RluA family pseudouridine synthase [Candidatus Zambryskibacteria bacterium]